MGLPALSIIICTYNGKRLVKRLLDSINEQDYDGKLEIICVDGGSGDGTLELFKRYNVKVYHNKKKFPEGAGMGKAQGVEIAHGEFVLIVDQDNKLIGKGCLKELIKPLVIDKEIFGCACRLFVDKGDSVTNRYLSYVGTDPFASNRSIEGKMALGKIKLDDCGGYYSYKIKKEDNLCTGGNCFVYRKKFLEKIGGYTQDVDVIGAFVNLGIDKMAVPKNAYTHHLAVSGFKEFLVKKWRWGWHYAFENRENRTAGWYPNGFRETIRFGGYLLFNLIFIPNLVIGIKKTLQYKDAVWLMHPVAVFFNTAIYCLIGFLGLVKR